MWTLESLNVEIQNSVKYIGYGAFYNCSSLENINIPNGIKKICLRAFYGCSKLTNITITENVIKISSRGFFGCLSLQSINIPKSVTKIFPMNCNIIKINEKQRFFKLIDLLLENI